VSVKDSILTTQPTSYWPLDDISGSAFCHDQMGLHDASLPSTGVTLSALPFGKSQTPFFDGKLRSVLTIPDDPHYSQPAANALTVAAWLCPLALNNANVVGGQDKYVHYVEKAVAQSVDVEWALRFYNQQNTTRHSRLSFYTFNLGSPTGEGNGSYMEYGVSKNDQTPVEIGQWLFVVGEAEPCISPTDLSTGCALWKQGVAANRENSDKYADFGVRPQHGSGSISVGGSQETGFQGSIAHLAIWNRLLSGDEIASIWNAGASDLRGSAMYHSFV
jgi:Concanavalin A-like lectin/glucanases superfamily